MSRNPRYDVLFEPVRIGPVTAPNRFYQTPHAVGTGNSMPYTRAGIREVRAEGGWGVINTGYCSIHPSSDDSPLPNGRLWDDEDIRTYVPMVEAVHRHGALAGVELWHGGSGTGNRYSRQNLISASGVSVNPTYPGWINLGQPRAMSKQDIADLRRWHVDAAIRARSAGFDIVYAYAGMNFGPYQFLLPWLNSRTDEYGGSLENRVRLTREILEDLQDAVGGQCAIALRFSTSELLQLPGENGESAAHDVISMLAELPDLWDIKSHDWTVETVSARFSDSAGQEPWTRFVKPLTSKPVVGVGRFTSPDEMVSQIKRGVLDLIGAARPSIADPFLPAKIDAGREDEIRECIGCNVCVSGYHDSVPLRCTQNPTMGEEWRRNWHPERVSAAGNHENNRMLVVGAGPAGLECALTLARRGYGVLLADAEQQPGGRVTRESALPGLASWARVRDYRINLLQRMPNVDIYLDNPVAADDILELECRGAILATGAFWCGDVPDAEGRTFVATDAATVYTPDDILNGSRPSGPVVIYDFDHYYMGSSIAELLREHTPDITLVTPAESVAPWTFMNNEKAYIRNRLDELGIRHITEHRVTGIDAEAVELTNIYAAKTTKRLECGSLVVVGTRRPNDALFRDLQKRDEETSSVGIEILRQIGDARTPGIIAHAVYSGHECGREIDTDPSELRIRRERPHI